MFAEKSLSYLLNISARLVKRSFDEKLKEYGITSSQCAVISLLQHENNLTQADIAEKFLADRATIGAVIDILIKKKLVTKILLEKDRRAYKVSITENGRNVVNKISEVENISNGNAFKGFTEKEIIDFQYSLTKIIRNLSNK